MVQRRKEKYRRAMVTRIMGEAVSIDNTVQTPADAYGLVAAKQYLTLMDSEKPKMSDLQKLGEMMTGASREDSQRSHEPNPGEIRIQPSALIELAAQIEAEQARRLAAARAVDGEVLPTIHAQIHETKNADLADSE
jgi:hypothetical protein